MALGDIGCALTDKLEIDPCGISNTCVTATCHATGNWFVTAYIDVSTNDVILISYEVDECGNIPCATQDSVTISTTGTASTGLGLIKTGDGQIVVQFHEACTGPQIESWTVDACGNFGCAADSTLDLDACDTAVSISHSIRETKYSDSDGIYCSLFNGTGSDLQMVTWGIDGCGTLTKKDQVEVDCSTLAATRASACYTGQGDYHIVVFADRNTDDGFAETFTIDSCGNIGTSADRHEWNAGDGRYPYVQPTQTAGTVVVVYGDSSASGDWQTLDIDACGVISNNSSLAVGSNTFDSTWMIPLDPPDNTYFMVVQNSEFRTVTVNACGGITNHDNLSSIVEVNAWGSIVVHPSTTGSGGFIVGAGYQITGQRLWVYSLSVHVGEAAAVVAPGGSAAVKMMANWNSFYP